MDKERRVKLLNLMKIAILYLSIGFILFSVGFNIFMRGTLEENAKVQLQKDAKIISQEVDSYFAKYGEIVNQMLTNEVFEDYLLSIEEGDSLKDGEKYDEVIKTLGKIERTDDKIALVWLGVPKTNNIVDSEAEWVEPDDYDMTSRPWYKEMTLTGEGVTYTNPYRDAANGKVVVSIIAPIVFDNEIIGNVGVDLNLSDINAYVESYKIGKKGYAILISDEKQMIVHPEEDLIFKSTIENLDKSSDQIFEEMISNKTGFIEYSYKGDVKYLAYNSVEINDWVIGSTILRSETRGFINSFNFMSGVLIAASIVIIVIFTIIIKLGNDFDELNKVYEVLKEKENDLINSHAEMETAYQKLYSADEKLKLKYGEVEIYSSQLESLKRKYDLAIELTNSSVWELDVAKGTIEFSHESFNKIHSTEETDTLKGVHDIQEFFKKYLEPSVARALQREFYHYIKGKRNSFYFQLPLKVSENQVKWILMHGRAVDDLNRKKSKINGILLDITKIKEQEEHIQEMADVDYLTGLPNRRKVIEILEETTKNHKKGAVILLDLDNFKEVNDTLGHIYGDEVLKAISKLLLSIGDENVFISRFGGDEFLIQVTNVETVEEVENYANRIVAAFKEALIVENEEIFISMSMGITFFPEDSNQVSKLIMNADLAMYKIKKSGKNNYGFFDESLTNRIKEKSKIEKILRRAMKKERFKIVYQPQVDSFNGEIVGFEALLRLFDYNISPNKFIPVAEETGQIIHIGRWVTEAVVKEIANFKEKGFLPKPIAINLSVKQINDMEYIDLLESLLKKYHVDPKLIDIEITENHLVENKEDTLDYLNKLKQIGVRLSLDDFGTGYSSLNYLTYLPVDKIKLDKTLSDKFLADKKLTVIDNIIALSHSLKLKVVAEGVETASQFEHLKRAKCDIIQGYYFSKPVELEEALKVYEKKYETNKNNV